MNRVMLYRSSHSRESIASPNKDIDAIKRRVRTRGAVSVDL